jgi:hypothetical protein
MAMNNYGKHACARSGGDGLFIAPLSSKSQKIEMFEQVDSSVTREYSGVGLKLYIVRNFTEPLDGEVTVVSKVAEGTNFTVWIPVAVDTDAAPAETGRKQWHKRITRDVIPYIAREFLTLVALWLVI